MFGCYLAAAGSGHSWKLDAGIAAAIPGAAAAFPTSLA
jgi:hypothetical protein